MGCGASKIDSELVKLCRERKESIMAARDSCNSLALAHMVYLQSLQNVENELKTFMEEALVICFNSTSDAGLDHQPSNSESCSLESNKNEDGDDVLSLKDYVNVGSNPSQTQAVIVSGQVQQPSDNFVFRPYRNEVSVADTVYMVPETSGSTNYARWESTNDYQMDLPLICFGPSQNQTLMPSTSNLGFNSDANGASFVSPTDYAVTNSRFFQNEGEAPQHYGMYNPSVNYEHYQTHFNHPSSSPHHEVSTWDYINPFYGFEGTSLDSYSQGWYGSCYLGNDIDLQELREREGIPDLEDEVDAPITENASGKDNLEMNKNLEKCVSVAADLKNGKDDLPDQKEDVRSSGNGQTKIRHEKKHRIKKEDAKSGPSSSVSEILKVEEIKESQTCNEEEDSFHKEMMKTKMLERYHLSSQPDKPVAEFMSELFANSSSDLRKVLTEIKDAFDNIVVHGKDVSKVFGPYQPGTDSTMGLSCSPCIENLASSSRGSLARRSTYKMLKMATDDSENIENETNTTSCKLSLTLDKLCIWENKLYEEVKNEEKLRENVDKEWRKLKKLDDKGEESSKFDAGHLSIKTLTTRISVAVTTIERIGRRTYMIRDEEVQPQLCELIQRMHIMWKFMSEAHEKQAQSIFKVQSNVQTACMAGESSLKATQKLEAEIRNLRTTFSDWIKSNRAFGEHLKNWLSKFLLQEPEKAQDAKNPSGSSRSPSTPAVFDICNDWCIAVEKVTETDVLQALKNFKKLLHHLCWCMHEERRLRLKIEYLSSYPERKLRKFCVENGLEWDQCASIISEFSDSTVETGFSPLHALFVSLRPIRMKLAQANVKHEEVVKRVNADAQTILQNGLAPLFEALRSFSSEMFNAFEQVRIPNGASAQGA